MKFKTLDANGTNYLQLNDSAVGKPEKFKIIQDQDMGEHVEETEGCKRKHMRAQSSFFYDLVNGISRGSCY